MLRGTRWGRLALCADLTPTLMPQPFTSRAASGRASLTALLLAGGLCALTAAPAVAQPAPAASSPTAPAAAGPLRERLKERLEQRRTERNAPEGDDEGPDELSDLGGRSGGAALSCADWSKRVERLSKLPRFKAASGPKPDLADVPYGPLERERLDVFRAKGPAGSPPAPVIVMVHGGGWCVGDKAMAGVTANKVARWTPKGLMLVSVNYPMVGDPTGVISRNFDVMIEEEGLALRGTFVINPEGQIKVAEIHDLGIGRSAKELVRKIQAAQYVATHDGEVCPAAWQPGAKTLAPSLDLVGKI